MNEGIIDIPFKIDTNFYWRAHVLGFIYFFSILVTSFKLFKIIAYVHQSSKQGIFSIHYLFTTPNILPR